MSRTMRLPVLLAAAALFWNGCATGALWQHKAFHVPAPEPNLRLSVAADHHDILVEYDELNERSDRVRRHAYLLEANADRVERGRKPRFVDPKRYRDVLPIPVYSEASAAAPDSRSAVELYATGKHDGFILHWRAREPSRHSLPVFFDGVTRTGQVLLTPPALIVDASIVSGVIIYYIVLPGLAKSGVSGTL